MLLAIAPYAGSLKLGCCAGFFVSFQQVIHLTRQKDFVNYAVKLNRVQQLT